MTNHDLPGMVCTQLLSCPLGGFGFSAGGFGGTPFEDLFGDIFGDIFGQGRAGGGDGRRRAGDREDGPARAQ